jgi:threonylcarbamoyladenosine tRNA methylthiotransferase MtaB
MYRALVERLAAAIPDLGLGTDLIVGHPGEQAEDFEATLALVRALPFTYLHVFAYSDRPGTEAARLGDRVAAAVARERSRRLRALGREKRWAFHRRLVGRRAAALALEGRDPRTGLLSGLTPNYVEVAFDGPDGLARRIVTVTVTDATADRALGRLEEISA